MDSTYYVAAIAILLFFLGWTIQCARDRRREIQRHKDAAVNYRSFVAEQKAKFIHDLVERLDLRKLVRFLPGLDLGLFSKIDDLYRDPFLRPYINPTVAKDEYDIRWNCEVKDLSDDELFILWFEDIIELATPEAQ